MPDTKTPKKQRKPTIRERIARIRLTIDETWDMSTQQQQVQIADDLLVAAMAAQRVVHNDSEPAHFINETNPMHRLVNLVESYAEHMHIPVSEIVDQITMHLGPIVAGLDGRGHSAPVVETETTRWN